MLNRSACIRIYTFLVLAAMVRLAGAQCSIVFDLAIPDNGTNIIEIDVAGLVNNDLAANQSVCQVNLNFRHNYVGDLTVNITSPAGQSVSLIGDITDQIDPTNLATWDIAFIPCADIPMPDAGFSPVWSNQQAWEVFGSYSGSYHPASGCLEDLNTGSANGIWELVITDASPNATGTLISVEIVFCDATGLSCSVCPAQEPSFEQPAIDLCEDTPIPANVFNVVYSDEPPDPDTTNLVYLISEGSMPVTFTSDPYNWPWSAGMYSVCALSYLEGDSTELFSVIDTMTIPEISTYLMSDVVELCARLSSSCAIVNVHTTPDTVTLNELICSGDIFEIDDQVFNVEGQYVIDLETDAGCDSTVLLNLSVIEISAHIAQLDTLTCDVTNVTLSAAGSMVPGLAEYQWATSGGIITGPDDGVTIQVSAPGLYSVTVTSQPSGCMSVRTWNLITDGSQPVIFIEDQVIDCNNPSIILDPVVFPANVTYQWSGPGGFTSDLPEPTVDQGGEYLLVATGPGGCSASHSLIVSVDTAIEVSATIRELKSCEMTTTRLQARPLELESVQWTGPSGFSSTARLITTPTPGVYTLTGIYDNGCSRVVSISVDHDYSYPDIMISASRDSISCGQVSTLTAMSPDPIDSLTWYGAGLTITDTSAITAYTSGEYIVEGAGVNGCVGHDTIEIYADPDLPPVNTFTDTLTCSIDTVTIGVITGAAVINYEWNGPGLVDTSLDFVRVTEPGNYVVQMTDLSGCVLYARIAVFADRIQPTATVFSDTITCLSAGSVLRYTTISDVTAVEWYRSGVLLGTDDTLSISDPGRYTLEVTSSNGCTRRISHTVVVDTLGPEFYLEPMTFGCQDSIMLRVTPFDSLTGYLWSGPSSFSSVVRDPYVQGPGMYVLTASGTNGCMSSRNVNVMLNTDPPEFEVAMELLDCIDSNAVYSASSMDTQALFAWFDLSGMLLSDSASVVLSQAGDYRLEVTGGNACAGSDTFTLSETINPAVFADPDTINCRDVEVELTAMGDSTSMSFEWFNELGTLIGMGSSFTAVSDGVYTVVGTWTNGCSSDTTVRVYKDTVPPVAIAATDEIVRCELREIKINGTASVGDSLAYQWRSITGSILLGANRDTAFVLGPGSFVLEVTDQGNHCSDMDTLDIIEEPSTLVAMQLQLVPECQGNLRGMIIFDSVYTADSPLKYYVGVRGQSSPVFDSLAIGEYIVSVVDSFGCRLDSLVEITETSSEATVDLGADIEILIGETATLQAILDIDSSMLSGIFWEPSLPCDSCLSNRVSPRETADFAINVRDPFGCVARDEITVFVIERGQYFIPNIFTPNGDGTNDVLQLTLHSGVAIVKSFSIYDRWGNLVFGSDPDTVPGTTTIAWDGTYNGKELNPAVYTYVLDIELLTGRREIHTGDFTLLR